MVHALAHSPRLQAGHLQERPDAMRIAAMSGAIAVNAIALLLLLMPMSTPPPAALPDKDPGMIWVLPEKKPEIVPVVPVQQAPPQKTQPATKSPPQANIASPTDQVIVEQGTKAVNNGESTLSSNRELSSPGQSIAAVRWSTPGPAPPPIPRERCGSAPKARCCCRCWSIATGGRRCQVQSSSGNRSLDEAARSMC